MALTKPAGTWTYQDLLDLPDDGRRYEIIDGVLYEMPSPSWDHMVILYNLTLLLGPAVSLLGGQLVFAPLDVFFPGADPVQPDMLAILPGSRAYHDQTGVHGPPDLVIEVLSPSNRRHDVLTKRAIYARGGVREYWIVDPDARTIDVLALDREELRTMQKASGEDVVVSPLLGGVEISLADVFANAGEEGSV